MFKNFIITCFLGMLGIILGAFGAHALKEVLTSDELISFNTAVRYQMYHVIVLLFVNMYTGFSTKQKNTISWLFFSGIFFFSGSIYAIQLTELTATSIWFITPIGGLFFILGWAFMLTGFLKKNEKEIKK
ncbi:MAG: DUF423 domain-containing protein [Polaribacter sp.]|jgi:uncharacterized membrane protein YgdD (TMEM256/DUF423 family)|uniref:DUF423 domain-containing protein n=1 Tax=uncultured Polaribacter sp. TaxID=174711 RepID=UPI0030D80D7C